LDEKSRLGLFGRRRSESLSGDSSSLVAQRLEVVLRSPALGRITRYPERERVAARKWPEEGFTRLWPDVIEMAPEIKRRVDDLWKKAGL
jgi:hypothetical protein